MKAYSTQNIRNVVLLGSTKSGKTTLSEAMLYEGKVIDRRGTVEGKNTVSDNAEIEQINQRSVYATPLYAEFMDTKFNIIDTPGADDFVGGAVSAFKVCDLGVLVVNAQQGVEVGTQIYARYAKNYHIPLVVAVNQLDGEKASWETTLESMKEAFGNKPVVVQYPVTVGPEFDGFIDVLKMKYYRFEGDTGKRQDLEIPADLLEEAEELRNQLIERAAEYDDTLMETFFEQGVLSEDEIRKGLGIGIRQGDVMPVFCLSAKKDIGVKRLMEFTIRTAASPAERPCVTKDGKTYECKQDAPVSLFIYKTAVEQHLGEVAYFKVMTGELTEGVDLENPETGDKERITAIYAVAGKKKEKVTDLKAGDIGCTVKLRAAKTNVTLCAPGADIAYKEIEFPHYKYRCAVKAKDAKDEEKVSEAMAKIAAEERPSPMTICTRGGVSMTPLMALALCSSKHRPKSGRVRYSSLSLHLVLVGSRSCSLAKSASSSDHTASWAAAWSARKRSMVNVLYRGPARPEPKRAGVFIFILRNFSPSTGLSTK